MNEINKRDFWDLPTMLLWSVFFAVGLVPELVFHFLQEAAAVPMSRALVNSSALITLSFSFFLAWFIYKNGLEPYTDKHEARGKATQAGLLALAAFLELPSKSGIFEVHTLLEIIVRLHSIPDWYLRFVIMIAALTKIFAWAYLFGLFAWYYMLGKRTAFLSMPSMFPSTWKSRENAESTDPPKEPENSLK